MIQSSKFIHSYLLGLNNGKRERKREREKGKVTDIEIEFTNWLRALRLSLAIFFVCQRETDKESETDRQRFIERQRERQGTRKRENEIEQKK